MNANGKGDRNRTADRESYAANYDRIFGRDGMPSFRVTARCREIHTVTYTAIVQADDAQGAMEKADPVATDTSPITNDAIIDAVERVNVEPENT